MSCQHALFALFHRFVGIPRLFEDGNPIVVYNHGEDCDLFDFRKPEETALGQYM
jgi:hypothetical protein